MTISRRLLLCASALCGSLTVSVPAAWAQSCATTTGPEGQKIVTCTGAVNATQNIGGGVDLFTNEGTLVVGGQAVAAGTATGDFVNNGTISSTAGAAAIRTIQIAGMRSDAVLTNNGDISTTVFGGVALEVTGAATVRNTGSIIATGAGNPVAMIIGGGSVSNAAGAEIHGAFGGIQSPGGVASVVNDGVISATGGTAVNLAGGSSVTNAGTVSGSSNAISIVGGGTVINRTGGSLTGTGIAPAVYLTGGSNLIENSGVIDTQGVSAGSPINVVLMRSADGGASTLINTATGVIGHAGIEAGANAVLGNFGGRITIANAGVMYGSLDLTDGTAGRTVFNGFDQNGVATAGPGRIEGGVYLGSSDDTVRNAGTINGAILLGGGVNTLVNAAGGIITGDISGNTSFSDIGTNSILLAGVLNGDGQFGGVTTLELSGTLNGTITLGGDDDTVIINGRPTITGANKIDVGGGGGDTVIFRGNTGAFDAWRANAEKMVKDGGGITILSSEGATYLGGITIDEGMLVFGEGESGGEIVGDAVVRDGGVYGLLGVHLGDLSIERGGVLIGTGSVGKRSDNGHRVINDGLVAMGERNGNETGVLTFTGDYTQTAGGQLNIRLGAPGQSDRLEVGGLATLAGEVNFIPLDLADTGAYTFMTYGSHVGQFDQINENGGVGLFFSYDVAYQADRATVSIVRTGAPPLPPVGCSPANPTPGVTVICTPPINSAFDFTAADLTVSVEGLLELSRADTLLANRGDNGTVRVVAGAGVVNTHASAGGALAIAGRNSTLRNAGVIDASGVSGPIISLSTPGDSHTFISNMAGARIGHAGVGVLALAASGGGDVTLQNDGTILGDIDFSGGGDDEIRNSGVIDGDIDMGAGSDVVRFGGSILGDVRLGDGNDLLGVDGAATLGVGSVIDGGAGHDIVSFTGGAGRWSAAQFANIDGLSKDGGGVTRLGGSWLLGPDATSLLVHSGTLELEVGAELSTGAEVDQGGVLLINGVIHDNVANARDGGLIGGSGAIGTAAALASGDKASLTNHAVVAPGGLAVGNEIGVLSVFGDYTQTATGRLDIHLGAPGTSDRLDVKGSAALAGAVNFIPLNLADTGAYTFLTYGARSGQFSAVQENGVPTGAGSTGSSVGLLFSYTVAYEADRATVSVVKTGNGSPGNGGGTPGGDPGDEPSILDVIANLTPNQKAVRDAFMADGAFSVDLATIRASLNGVNAGRAAAALDSYSGETYAALPFVTGQAGRAFGAAVGGRMDGDVETGRDGVLWAQSLISSGRQDSSSRGSGHDHDLTGVAVGADRRFGDVRAGVAVGYSSSRMDQSRLGAAGKGDSIHAGAYASATFGAAFVDAQAGYARHEFDIRRTLITGDASRQAVGAVEADEVRLAVKGGYATPVDGGEIRPFVRLEYADVMQDALRETGAGDAGLTLGQGQYDALTAAVGLDARWSVGAVRPAASLAVGHELLRDGWTIRSRMAGGGGEFLVHGVEPGRTVGQLGLGLSGDLGPAELTMRYELEARDGYTAQALTAGLKVRW